VTTNGPYPITSPNPRESFLEVAPAKKNEGCSRRQGKYFETRGEKIQEGQVMSWDQIAVEDLPTGVDWRAIKVERISGINQLSFMEQEPAHPNLLRLLLVSRNNLIYCR